MLKKTIKLFSYGLLLISLGLAIRFIANTFVADVSSKHIDSTPFFSASLPDIAGVTQPFKKYQGKIIIVNFWATWCPPCIKEMPELSEFQQQYQHQNVVVLGVALDESSAVNAFLKKSPVSYPIYVGENEGNLLSDQLGNHNGVLPYTIVINIKGEIIKTHLGRINRSMLEQIVHPLLSQR